MSHGRSLGIPRGRGVLQDKILEAKYEAKLEFPEGRWGGGSKAKTFRGGSTGTAQWLQREQVKTMIIIILFILRRNPLGKRVIRMIGGQKSQDALRAQLCLLSQLSRISLSFTMTSGYKQTEMERRRHLLRMYGEKK